MAYLSKPPPFVSFHSKVSIFPHSSHVILSLPKYQTTSLRSRFRALQTVPDGSRTGSHESYRSDFLRKPVLSPGKDLVGISEQVEESEGKVNYEDDEEDGVYWEDKILEDTVPLVGFVRMILRSGKYRSGDKLSPEHEKTILERLLPYHPQCEKKIGCGIDYLTVGYHPDFEGSRCLFIVRKDGELVDFSYWKCIKGLIKKNYPQYAESFILRHFSQRKRTY